MREVVEKLIEQGKTISTMESCTGGGVADSITSIEGASEILKFSAVTYSNEFKIEKTHCKRSGFLPTIYFTTRTLITPSIAFNFSTTSAVTGESTSINAYAYSPFPLFVISEILIFASPKIAVY